MFKKFIQLTGIQAMQAQSRFFDARVNDGYLYLITSDDQILSRRRDVPASKSSTIERAIKLYDMRKYHDPKYAINAGFAHSEALDAVTCKFVEISKNSACGFNHTEWACIRIFRNHIQGTALEPNAVY